MKKRYLSVLGQLFFEMLVINYSNKGDSFDNLQKKYQEILERDELDFWKFLERKVKMLENELICYLQIESDFSELFELNKTYIPNKLIAGSTDENNLPLLENRYVSRETFIYVCVNKACKLPVTEVEEAIKLIKE